MNNFYGRNVLHRKNLSKHKAQILRKQGIH